MHQALTFYGPSPPCSQPLANTVLTSLRISLFRIVHLQGVTQDAIFCAWLLSLSLVLSRVIHVVASLQLHSFYWLNNIPV